MVKSLLAKWETQVGTLDQEDPPGKGTGYPLQYSRASLVTQLVKNPSAMWETWVQSLGWEDPLKEVVATHSIFLAGESLCTV